jgi:hypothetical protein
MACLDDPQAMRLRRRHDSPPPEATVTIRPLDHSDADRRAIDELAERDSGRRPDGPALVAEVDGRLLAAISLESRAVLADPFARTDELRSLLELRAAQLRRHEARRRPRRGERRERTRARAALAGSPPGAGGKLLRIP